MFVHLASPAEGGQGRTNRALSCGSHQPRSQHLGSNGGGHYTVSRGSPPPLLSPEAVSPPGSFRLRRATLEDPRADLRKDKDIGFGFKWVWGQIPNQPRRGPGSAARVANSATLDERLSPLRRGSLFRQRAGDVRGLLSGLVVRLRQGSAPARQPGSLPLLSSGPLRWPSPAPQPRAREEGGTQSVRHAPRPGLCSFEERGSHDRVTEGPRRRRPTLGARGDGGQRAGEAAPSSPPGASLIDG